ncbi:MAG: hypothetical protein GY822_08130 [Deltaproteobacteria bacterium]|nr:hypothetical protein [Deltaproteobacteria bacterium]
MPDQKPKLNPDIDVTKLLLNAEEGFVLSRIDGFSDEKAIAQVAGLPSEKVAAILQKLQAEGALLGDSTTTELAKKPKSELQKTELNQNVPASLEEDVENKAERESEKRSEEREPGAEAVADSSEEGVVGDEVEDVSDDVAENKLSKEEAEEEEDEVRRGEADYMKIYAEKFKGLDVDAKVEFAETSRGADFCAMCFDPDPRVMRAILDNGRVSQKQGRLIAKHHHTSTGLEMLGRKGVLLRDFTVQRFLLRNPQTSEALLRKMMQPKRLLEYFKMTNNREATERMRRTARKLFRTRFQQADADEKVSLLFTTEGRCLLQLTGVPLDGKTLSLLCGRIYASTLLVQNLARSAATPPKLLEVLFKQHIVKRSAQLKNVILKHPNCPSNLKRKP